MAGHTALISASAKFGAMVALNFGVEGANPKLRTTVASKFGFAVWATPLLLPLVDRVGSQ